MSPHVDYTTRIFLSVVGSVTHSNKAYNVVCELVAKDVLAGEVETLPFMDQTLDFDIHPFLVAFYLCGSELLVKILCVTDSLRETGNRVMRVTTYVGEYGGRVKLPYGRDCIMDLSRSNKDFTLSWSSDVVQTLRSSSQNDEMVITSRPVVIETGGVHIFGAIDT